MRSCTSRVSDTHIVHSYPPYDTPRSQYAPRFDYYYMLSGLRARDENDRDGNNQRCSESWGRHAGTYPPCQPWYSVFHDTHRHHFRPPKLMVSFRSLGRMESSNTLNVGQRDSNAASAVIAGTCAVHQWQCLNMHGNRITHHSTFFLDA